MKKSIFFYLPLILSLICLGSCSYNDAQELEAPGTTKEDYKISPIEAIKLVENFISAQETYDLSRSSNTFDNRKIASVEALRNDFIQSRTFNNSNLSIDLDTLLYAVNFEDNKGFALVSADKRTEPILAIVEDGALCPDTLSENANKGFLIFLEEAILMEQYEIERHKEPEHNLITNNYTIKSYYQPILHTRWAQTGIYGRYCPNGIAGCAIIATAQILSHFQTINQVNWSYNNTSGSAFLHWDKIISDCDNHSGKLTDLDCYSSGNEIAHIARYLGLAMDATYSDKSTGCKESKAIEWFNKWSGLKASKLKDYDENEIISSIKRGNPVYARGNTGKNSFLGIRISWKGGHAWVYDGFLTASKDGKTSTFIHCNWGWGGKDNGYYLSKVFNTKEGAPIYDPEEIQDDSPNDPNYNCHLQYSIISR